jgi:hypothetical protein
MRNKTGLTLLIIGGIMMIISATVGSIGIYEFLSDYVSTEYPDYAELADIVIIVIRFIADWGGGAIIFGAFLIILKQIRLGKWIIGVGLTFGSLALIIWIISKIIDITGIIDDPQILLHLDRLKEFFTYGVGLQFTGVLIALIGRYFIRKPKKKKEKVKAEEKGEGSEEIEESESSNLKSSES